MTYLEKLRWSVTIKRADVMTKKNPDEIILKHVSNYVRSQEAATTKCVHITYRNTLNSMSYNKLYFFRQVMYNCSQGTGTTKAKESEGH